MFKMKLWHSVPVWAKGSIPFVFLGLLCVSTTFAQPAETWRTGQTVSYGAGDDGDVQAGVVWPTPRFSDNRDGTITDYLTGLIWLKNANCFGTRNWSDALNLSNGLASGSCGLSDGSLAGDWRLPNRKEVFSLVDFSSFRPALPDGHRFTNVQSSGYWTASTYAGDSSRAWLVIFIAGTSGHNNKTYDSLYYVACTAQVSCTPTCCQKTFSTMPPRVGLRVSR